MLLVLYIKPILLLLLLLCFKPILLQLSAGHTLPRRTRLICLICASVYV